MVRLGIKKLSIALKNVAANNNRWTLIAAV